MKGGIYRADPRLNRAPPLAHRPHGPARKKDSLPWGGWHSDMPNRNAEPQKGRHGVLISRQGDDSGLGVSGSLRGDAAGYPGLGIFTRLRFRQRLVTRSTRSPSRTPKRNPRVASHNSDYIQIPYSGDVTWASWMVSGVMSTGGGRRPGLTWGAVGRLGQPRMSRSWFRALTADETRAQTSFGSFAAMMSA